MPVVFQVPASNALDLEQFRRQLALLTSNRKVRPVITPSGKRARGHFPSIKSTGLVRFESLLEQDVLRALEVASTVQRYQTHPVVLALPGEKVIHYTPDVLVEGEDGGVLIETKATYYLKQPKTRVRMLEVVRRLRTHQIPLLLIVEGDIRPPALQQELKELLRQRPSIGRRRENINPTNWSPLGESNNPEMERRWRAAQLECDQLLQRVMRRDPGELIASVS